MYATHPTLPSGLFSNQVLRSQTCFRFRHQTARFCSPSMTSFFSRIDGPCDLNVIGGSKKRKDVLRCCDSVYHQLMAWQAPEGQELSQLDIKPHLTNPRTHPQISLTKRQRQRICWLPGDVFGRWTHCVNNNMVRLKRRARDQWAFPQLMVFSTHHRRTFYFDRC